MLPKRFWKYGLAVIFAGFLTAATFFYFMWFNVPEFDASMLLPPQEPVKHGGMRFHAEIQAYGGGKDGSTFCTISYRHEDGTPAHRTVFFYRSAAAAREEKERMIQRSSILERRVKRDPDGKPIGERVVLMTRPSRSRETEAAIVWTHGDSLYVLHSLSLHHVLAFEKQAFPWPDHEGQQPSRLDPLRLPSGPRI